MSPFLQSPHEILVTPGFCGSLMHYALPRSVPLSVPLLSLQPPSRFWAWKQEPCPVSVSSGHSHQGFSALLTFGTNTVSAPKSSTANPASLQSPLPTGQPLSPWEQPHPFPSKPLPLGTLLRLSAATHRRPPDPAPGSSASGGQWASPPRGRLLETLRSWNHHENP